MPRQTQAEYKGTFQMAVAIYSRRKTMENCCKMEIFKVSRKAITGKK